MADRMEKINQQIKVEVSKLVQDIFHEDLVTVKDVVVSKDLSYAKIWISSLKNLDQKVKEANNRAKEIRTKLARELYLRKVPAVHFLADTSSQKVDRIENLLKEISDK